MKNKSFLAISSIILGIFLLFYILFYFMPLDILTPQPKHKAYDYYIILDEKSGVDLMTVPILVSIGDEVITENNQRYKVINIEENRAYARFVEDLKMK